MASLISSLIIHLSLNLFLQLGKYHPPAGCLQYAGYCNIYILPHMPSGIINYYHSAVLEIANALPLFLSFLKYKDIHNLTGKYSGPHGSCQLIKVQNRYTLQYIQPALAPRPFYRVRRIRYILQLPQHKLGYYHRAIYKAYLADIGYPAIYNNTGIQYLHAAVFLIAGHILQMAVSEFIALSHANAKPYIAGHAINQQVCHQFKVWIL